jgi:hypothetical protein
VDPLNLLYHLYVVKTTMTLGRNQCVRRMYGIMLVVPVSNIIISTKLKAMIGFPATRLHPEIDGNGGGLAAEIN